MGSSINNEEVIKKVGKIINEIKSETTVSMYRFKLSDEKTSIFDSKAGGLGYVPHDCKIPSDSNGNQLRLLAQIDCSEIDLEDFPEKGLLQFWILVDDVYGLNFDDNTLQDTFKVIYYPEIDKTVTSEDVQAKSTPFDDEFGFPVFGEYKLVFEKNTDYISVECCSEYYHVNELFCQKYNREFPGNPINNMFDIPIEFDEVPEHENSYDDTMGHKIGGFPGFTQYDPRSEDDNHDFLLFQLDSDYSENIDKVMWGDSGICNFFINRDKLKKCDFSDVIYNWDCC